MSWSKYDESYFLFSCIAMMLALAPLPWNFRSWNVGIPCIGVYTAMSCLINIVNHIVWANNDYDSFPVWCDITSKLLVGLPIGLSAAALCVARRLYICLGPSRSPLKAQMRKAFHFDFFFAVGVPLFVTGPLYTLVRGWRYEIVFDRGCLPAPHEDLGSHLLIHGWPVLLGTTALVYGGLALRAFVTYDEDIENIAAPNVPALDRSHVIGLVGLATATAVLGMPPAVCRIFMDMSSGDVIRWIPWDYERIYQPVVLFTFTETKELHAINGLFSWIPNIIGLVYFLSLSLVQEDQPEHPPTPPTIEEKAMHQA
ncbi:fungal pheromone STE3G-protein-coupled receptor [Sistotremastrum niveocremeum HHB9708]|uniref:Fungal pheromone STE3G-protein-coupled receptor n=1 Tax=Sistotremastrum niveocremeum HHB9708 TaxID=1314777 RepID=A0A164V364_9AGAM|nr:fungal pheromone STE3G-protein-coupled receptor [Sistotremastrum niveocremeum HHB9708]